MSVVDEAQLFEIEKPPPVSLADKFGVPPFSVLDRRGGEWQARKRQWGRLGIQSEIGRDSIVNRLNIGDNGLALMLRSGAKGMGVPLADGISVFDPVVCELAYRWHTLPGDRILDPFAGGSVRGIVASSPAADTRSRRVQLSPTDRAGTGPQLHTQQNPRLSADTRRGPHRKDSNGSHCEPPHPRPRR